MKQCFSLNTKIYLIWNKITIIYNIDVPFVLEYLINCRFYFLVRVSIYFQTNIYRKSSTSGDRSVHSGNGNGETVISRINMTKKITINQLVDKNGMSRLNIQWPNEINSIYTYCILYIVYLKIYISFFYFSLISNN